MDEVATEPSEAAWFACFTTPRHEKRVLQRLQSRGIDGFLPTYPVKRHWRNRQTVTLDMPLFPSYVFVRTLSCNKSELLSISGLLHIVGGSRGAATLSPDYIDMLRAGVELKALEPHAFVQEGDRVKVVSGPFRGMEGTLLRKGPSTRILISIELIHSCVSLEVSWSDIDLIDTPHLRQKIAVPFARSR